MTVVIRPVPTCFSTSFATVSRSSPTLLEHSDSDTLTQTDQAEQKVLGARNYVF